MSRHPPLLALALAALLGLLPGRARAAAPYDVYGVLSLTGSGAFLGNEEARTLHAIETVVNAQGGIKGGPLHFIIADDTSSPTVAVQLATAIIARNVPIMLGPTLVASCNAVAPLFRDGPVQYCFAPGVYPPAGSFTFAAGVSTRDFVVAGLRYFRARGWRRIAVITSADATGQEGDRVINAGLALPENKDDIVVARAHFGITDVSADAQMASIAAAKPQVIIAWTTGTPFATVLHAYTNNGMSVPLLTNSGNIARKQMEQYAAFAPRQLLFTTTRYLAYPGDTAAAESHDPVVAAQKLFFGTIARAGLNPDTGPVIAWDTGGIVVDALQHLGSPVTAAALHDYLEQRHGFVGIDGTFDFRGGNQRGLTLSSAIVVRWDAPTKSWLPVSAPGGTPLP